MRRALIVLIALAIGLVLVAQLAAFMGRSREPVARAEAPTDPQTRFVQTRSGRVHILDVGAGEQVILLLHGTGRSVADWQEGLAELLAERHRVVGIDYYGHGASDRAHGWQYGIALWARQARDVLDALGIDRVTVVGHSAGGCVAAIFAADFPDRVERAVFVGHGLAMDPMQLLPLIPGIGDLHMARVPIFSDTFSEAHARRLAGAYEIRGTRSALLVFLRRQYTIDGLRLLTGTYESIRRPVLQVHGSEDASIPLPAAQGLTSRLADARLQVAEGVGHDVPIAATAWLAQSITEFMDAPHDLAKASVAGRSGR